MIRDLTLQSGTYALAAKLFEPAAPPARAYVLHGATGVPRDYYTKFAQWVADQGHAILIYAYRRDDDPRRSRITMSDWGVADQSAALNQIITLYPEAEIRVIGHSLGGFMTMFHEQAARISSLTAVCSGPAYWPRTPMPKRIGTFAFWHLLGPLACWATGALPGRLLGTTDATPAPAFFQWRQWCGNPDLHRPQWGRGLPEPDVNAFTGRLNLVGVSDDWMIPPDVVADLAPFYPAARAEFHEVSPADAGTSAIGHLSIFRPRAAALWPRLL